MSQTNCVEVLHATLSAESVTRLGSGVTSGLNVGSTSRNVRISEQIIATPTFLRSALGRLRLCWFCVRVLCCCCV